MATNWIVVPNLDEFKQQMDERFPKRDKKSDGSIGNQAHAAGTSSHNPDKSGKAEWKDGDSKNEVRARDIDKDLRDDETDTTMEHVVQMLVAQLRAGKLWWVRYMIYNKRIWHRRDGFKTRVYTGSNKHTEHLHLNSDFTKKADDVKGTNWGLKNFRRKKPTTPATPAKPSTPPAKPSLGRVDVDGKLGPNTIKLWQKIMKTTVDGKIDSDDSELIRAVQRRLQVTDHRLKVDGQFGPATIRRLQSYLKAPVDGVLSKPVSITVKALQTRLNTGKF